MKWVALALLCLSVGLPVHAQDPQASEASVRKLLEVTESKKMLDGLYAQLEEAMQAQMQQAMDTKTLNSAQQKILDDTRKKMIGLFKAEMAWSTFEPILVGNYRKAFTESEVQGILQFYDSAAGKAFITKMPDVMQASMEAAQGRMTALVPKLQKLEDDTVAKLKAAATK